MRTPDTITRGAGQARRSAARLILTVAKYAALTVAGIILFRAGAAYGLQERGYRALGGEVFALLPPVLYPLISPVVRDIIADAKNGFKPNFKEENEHEKAC